MNNDTVQKSVKIYLNNTIFKCEIDQKLHNLEDSKAYIVASLGAVVPAGAGQVTMSLGSLVICEDCWKENTDGKGLKLKEPSNIVVANGKLPDFMQKR